jgi:nicotinamide-nucleotide amidase
MMVRIEAEIIIIGSELLTPYYIDTNSQYITEKLNDLGIDVRFKTVVGDREEDIIQCIKQALKRSKLIFACGGLGPTRDDLTRFAFSKALNRKLMYHLEVEKKIEKRFKRRGLTMPSICKRQAYILENAKILENEWGTAPGMKLEEGESLIYILPGPPQELKPMFEKYIYNELKSTSQQFIYREKLGITGLTESQVETLISDLYKNKKNIKVSILAYPGQIEIHITGCSDKEYSEAVSFVKGIVTKFKKRLKENIFTTSGERLEEVVGKLLKERNETLAVAESCSGGYLSNRITNVSGSSNYFERGIVTYSNEAKIENLGVSVDLIKKFGAVSKKVAEAMAIGIRKLANTDYGVSITGIAGPTGGTPQKPVGLVYIGLSWKNGVLVTKNHFLGDRESIKFQSTQKALDMLRRHLLNKSKCKNQK